MKYIIERDITHNNTSKTMRIEIDAVGMHIYMNKTLMLSSPDINNLSMIFSAASELLKKYEDKNKIKGESDGNKHT